MKHISNILQKFMKSRSQSRPHVMARSSYAHRSALSQLGLDTRAPHAYRHMAQEGYGKNIIVYRSVSLIARNLASVTWRLQQGDQILEKHPLLDC